MQHRTRRLLLGAAWGLAAAATHASAEEPARLQAVTVSGASDSEVASRDAGATKTDTPLTDTPQSISVIGAEEIAARGASTMMEALRYTAGAAVETYGPDGRGYDWVKLRGFDTFPSQFRDGMRLFNYDFMEPYGLERIEVLRGPSSVLYGQSVPGGLINGVSKLPQHTAQHEVALSYGSFGEVQGQFDLTGPLLRDSGLDYRLIGLQREGGNQIAFPDGEGYPARRQYLAPALSWRPAAETRITVLAERLHQAGMFANYASAPDGGPTTVVIDDRGYDADVTRLWNLGWQVDQGFGDALNFHHKLRFNHRDEAQPYLSALGYNTMDQPTLLDRSASSYFSGASSWTTDNTLEWKTRSGAVAHVLLAGVDYGSNHFHDDYFYGDAPPLDIAHPVYHQDIPLPTEEFSGVRQHQSQLGVYLQDQAYWQQWIVTASLRRDWAHDRNSDAVTGSPTSQFDAAYSGRVGLTWKTAIGVAPYLSWSRSFQPNSGADVSGKPFSPTHGRQYEVGAKYATAGDSAIYTVSLFRLVQDNVLTTDPTNPAFNAETGQIRSQGVELEGKGRLTRTLDWSASYTWDPVKVTRSGDPVEQDKTPILTPQTNASLWLSHTSREGWLEGLGLSAGVRHTGATWGDTANTVRNTQLTLLDLAARYPLRGFELGVNLNNVLDRTSFIATPYGNYLTAKRVVMGSLRYQW